jgi:hypothetical protein
VPISGSPISVFWESAEAHYSRTTIEGTGTTTVLSASEENLYLYVRDIYGNAFNYTYWQQAYQSAPVYLVELTGDGDMIDVLLTHQLPDIGQFFFLFVAKLNYSNLVLSISIYSLSQSAYIHIPGSPFKLGIITMSKDLYCEYLDMLYVGYGFSTLTHIYLLPSTVVAGSLFVTQVSPRNVFD